MESSKLIILIKNNFYLYTNIKLKNMDSTILDCAKVLAIRLIQFALFIATMSVGVYKLISLLL